MYKKQDKNKWVFARLGFDKFYGFLELIFSKDFIKLKEEKC